MDAADRRAHWDDVYASKAEDEVSWFQETATASLETIRATGLAKDGAIIDIGGGASRLVDALLDDGYRDVTVLDLSTVALAAARARLGNRAVQARWIAADVTRWQPPMAYDLWHDRAAFHFLTDETDREAYVTRLEMALRPGGHAIIATFAPDGPERCSGLPVVRYDADSLAATLGGAFRLVASRDQAHRTPAGRIQSFQFSWFRRA